MWRRRNLEREQAHSKAKDTLEEIIKDQTVKDSVKQDAVDKLAMLSEQMEMETAAENLLGAKGFLNSQLLRLRMGRWMCW